jgi:hypothetical protein
VVVLGVQQQHAAAGEGCRRGLRPEAGVVHLVARWVQLEGLQAAVPCHLLALQQQQQRQRVGVVPQRAVLQ